MNSQPRENQKKALLSSLYQRVRGRLRFLGDKKYRLIADAARRSDTDKLQKAREELMKK